MATVLFHPYSRNIPRCRPLRYAPLRPIRRGERSPPLTAPPWHEDPLLPSRLQFPGSQSLPNHYFLALVDQPSDHREARSLADREHNSIRPRHIVYEVTTDSLPCGRSPPADRSSPPRRVGPGTAPCS